MSKTETKKNSPINTSGWTDEEIKMLDSLVKEDGSDRSKVVRATVRKEYAEREHNKRIWRNVKAHIVRKNRVAV